MTANGAKKTSSIGKFFGALFLLAFTCIPALFLFFIAYSVWTDLSVYFFWQKASCIVEESVIDRLEGKDTPYRVSVRYARQDASTEIRGGDIARKSMFSQPAPSFSKFAEAEALRSRYAAGSRCECYFNPANPSEMVLERRLPYYVVMGLIPLLLLAMALIVAMGVFSPDSSEETKSKPLSRRAAATKPGNLLRAVGCLCGALFFLPFFLAGVFVFHSFVVEPQRKAYEIRAWQEQRCTVITSEVLVIDGDDSTTYRPDIFYRYEIRGMEYRSNTYDPYPSSPGYGRKESRSIVSRYPPGAEVQCFVNLQNPGESVLSPHLRPDFLYGLFGSLFALTGLGGGGYFLYKLFQPALLARERSRATVVFRSGASRRTVKLIGILLFNLFWNGIVLMLGVMCYRARCYAQGKGMGILAALVIGLFGLCGLAGLGALAGGIRALFSPGLEITCHREKLRLGAKAAFSWKVLGSTRRIRRLLAALEGEEIAARSSGDDTVEEKSLFASLPLIDERHPGKEGLSEIEIPLLLPPTWTSDNNRIAWSLRFVLHLEDETKVHDEFTVEISAAGPGDMGNRGFESSAALKRPR